MRVSDIDRPQGARRLLRRGLVLLLVAASALATPGAAGAVSVAVFDDPAYVDTTSDAPGAESDNVQASLAYLGHAWTPFAGTDAFGAALAGQEVLLIPELENGDLAAALPPDAITAIRGFVANGGGLVVHGANSGLMSALLSAVFGFPNGGEVSVGDSPRTPDADATDFVRGPEALPSNDATAALAGGLPAGALALYGEGGSAAVAAFRYGSGRIVYLGWDWYDAVPIGAQDGGWLDVLDRAVRWAAGPQIVIFADPAFVDTTGGPGSEVDNVRAALVALGRHPIPIQSQLDLGASLPTADLLLVPELEIGDLAASLTPDDVTAIQGFVAGGGGLIVNGTPTSNELGRATGLLSTLFGVGLTASQPGLESASLANPRGTAFTGAASQIPYYNATDAITAGLPAGGLVVYGAPDASPVVALPYGAGQIVYLGWDWFDAAPLGSQDQDGAWASVLRAAVIQATRGCGDAIDVPSDGGIFTGTTGGVSTQSYSEGMCGPSPQFLGDLAPEWVFRWTAPRDGVAHVTTCGSSFDTVLYIRADACAAGLDAPLAGGCNDDDPTVCGSGSSIDPPVLGGHTYFIVVDGYGASSGAFTLTVTPPPAATSTTTTSSTSTTTSTSTTSSTTSTSTSSSTTASSTTSTSSSTSTTESTSTSSSTTTSSTSSTTTSTTGTTPTTTSTSTSSTIVASTTSTSSTSTTESTSTTSSSTTTSSTSSTTSTTESTSTTSSSTTSSRPPETSTTSSTSSSIVQATTTSTTSTTEPPCGNGRLDPGEQCDDGNAFDNDCCSSRCRALRRGQPCGSGAVGECDEDDTCDSEGHCVDNHKPAGTVCREPGAVDACDAGDACDGESNECPVEGQGVGCGVTAPETAVGSKQIPVDCRAQAATVEGGTSRCSAVGFEALGLPRAATVSATDPGGVAGRQVTTRVSRRLQVGGSFREGVLKLKLNPLGRKLLRRQGSLKVSVRVTINHGTAVRQLSRLVELVRKR